MAPRLAGRTDGSQALRRQNLGRATLRSGLIFGAVLTCSAAATGAFVACGQSRAPASPAPKATPHHSSRRTALPERSAPTADPRAALGTPGDAGTTAPGNSGASASVAPSAHCGTSMATIAAWPADGVIFNNAMTSADAGARDRGAGVLKALDGARSALECCLDDWARQHQGAAATLMLLVELEVDGRVARASIDDARSSLSDETAGACAAAVAGSLHYPASPAGVATLVEYPLRVHASAQ